MRYENDPTEQTATVQKMQEGFRFQMAALDFEQDMPPVMQF